MKRSDLVAASEYRYILDMFFTEETVPPDAAHPSADNPTSDDSDQASHGPGQTEAGGGVDYGEATPADGPEDEDSGTATESLSDGSEPDDGEVDRNVNVEISQPGIAFYFKGKPG